MVAQECSYWGEGLVDEAAEKVRFKFNVSAARVRGPG